MKYLLALLFMVCSTAGQQECPKDMSPNVHKFITEKILVDDSKLYKDTRAWLQVQKNLPDKDKDKMWEIVSGLVWEKDKALAIQLIRNIKCEKMRKQIIEHYNTLNKIELQECGTSV